MNILTSEFSRDLIGNATLILALCFLYRLALKRTAHSPLARGLVLGLLFGLAATASMLIAIEYLPGIIFDGRTIMLTLSGLFGGPLAAAISGIAAATYRLAIGGPGSAVGLAVIAVACGTGLAMRPLLRRPGGQGWKLLLAGALVHVCALALFFLLPAVPGSGFLSGMAPSYLLVLTAGTWVSGLLLADIERYQNFDEVLIESRDRFRFLFQSTATALLDEDLSAVYRAVDGLRAEGVTDLRAHLLSNPETLTALIRRVHVRAANPAAIALFGEHSEQALTDSIDRHFAPDSAHTFLEGLCAYWERRDWMREETQLMKSDGTIMQVLLAMPIARDPEHARHIPVNIIDISALRRREKELREQQSHLEGILWGTDAGTWEWHIPSDALRLNPRWASLLDYGQQFPPPTTFDARRKMIHPDDLARSDRLLARLIAGETASYECELRMQRAHGGWQWMLERGKVTSRDASGAPVRLAGILLDIDERRKAVDRAARLSSVREALLTCHMELLRASSERELFQRTVDALVRTRGYRLAWIGSVRKGAAPLIEILARAGDASDFTETLGDLFRLSGTRQSTDMSPAELAALTGEPRVVDDLTADPRDTPWKSRASELGLKAAMIIPVLQPGGDILLCLYSDQPGIFVGEERRLLEDFSSSLTLALRSLRERREAI